MLTFRVGLLKKLAPSSWGLNATILGIATLFLVHSTDEYCVPVRCRSAHTCLIDKPIKDALHIVTGCLRTTPTDNLFIFSGIQSTEFRRQKTVLSLARRAQESVRLLYERLLSPLGGQLWQLT